jgi:hypothetical protein
MALMLVNTYLSIRLIRLLTVIKDAQVLRVFVCDILRDYNIEERSFLVPSPAKKLTARLEASFNHETRLNFVFSALL